MPRTPPRCSSLPTCANSSRIERLRLRLIDGQPVQAGDLMLLVDRARDGIMGEMRAAKARLQRARAA